VRIEGRRRVRRLLDLAPLVDVVFLLLVFFLLATRFDRDRALPLEIASTSASRPPPEEAPLDIELLDDGGLRLDGRPLDPGSLASVIEAAGNRPVTLRPGADVALSRIHHVLEVASEAGASGVSLVRSF